ncbi:unnamed protein product, partial [Scytosiphon promiscuus]
GGGREGRKEYGACCGLEPRTWLGLETNVKIKVPCIHRPAEGGGRRVCGDGTICGFGSELHDGAGSYARRRPDRHRRGEYGYARDGRLRCSLEQVGSQEDLCCLEPHLLGDMEGGCTSKGGG